MSGNGEEAIGVDRRLPVLGRDDDGGRTEKTVILERLDHLPDRGIDEFDLAQHAGGGSARGVGVTSLDALDQLLPNADGLEIHAKNCGHRSAARPEVVLAIDLVDHGIDL